MRNSDSPTSAIAQQHDASSCSAPGDQAAGTAPSAPADREKHVLRPRWRVLLIGSGLALAALLVDQGATNWLTDEVVRYRIIVLFGLPAAAAVFVVPLAVFASFPNGRRLCVGFVIPLLLSTFITHALKWLVGRARPHMDLGPLHFRPLAWIGDPEAFAWKGDFESFPSGHAAAAAALAVLLGIYFPKARWVFYFFAGLVGLERVINDKHFLSDVLAGFVIGVFSVYACVGMLGAQYYRKELPPTAAKAA